MPLTCRRGHASYITYFSIAEARRNQEISFLFTSVLVYIENKCCISGASVSGDVRDVPHDEDED